MNNYLLDQQLRQLEKQFLEEGGFTEKLYLVTTTGQEKIIFSLVIIYRLPPLWTKLSYYPII